LISPYEPKNIYNADKTGLFFRVSPTKSLAVKGEKCIGGKTSKERLTVLLCGNMVENLKINNFPVIWRNNEKAGMTAATMEEWLNMFNAKMTKEIEIAMCRGVVM
jgi:hypothetical protein